MTKKSARDIEFAIRMAIAALRREIGTVDRQPALGYEPNTSDANQYNKCHRPHEKHRRDLERAVSILKAIKLECDEG